MSVGQMCDEIDYVSDVSVVNFAPLRNQLHDISPQGNVKLSKQGLDPHTEGQTLCLASYAVTFHVLRM
jgi:hypothetical protein